MSSGFQHQCLLSVAISVKPVTFKINPVQSRKFEVLCNPNVSNNNFYLIFIFFYQKFLVTFMNFFAQKVMFVTYYMIEYYMLIYVNPKTVSYTHLTAAHR